MNERIIIYGRNSCPFCVYSVDLCIARNVPYIFLDYQDRPEILEECKEFYSHSTVPIVLSNKLDSGLVKKIGGYSDLVEHYS